MLKLPRNLRVAFSVLLLTGLGLRVTVKQQRSLTTLQMHYEIAHGIFDLPTTIIPRKKERVAFIHTGASREEMDAFFALPDLERSNNQRRPVIEPLWSCREGKGVIQHRPNKFFLHMLPRTGGVTIRALLKGYAMACNTSLAVVSKCVFLGREFMERGDIQNHWSNGIDTIHMGKSCVLESATNRSGHVIVPVTDRHLNTDFLIEHDIDIISGQVPMGADEFWTVNRTKVPVQDMVMFRHPLERFVSQFIRNHRLPLEDAIELMHKTVQEKVSSDQFHEVYTRLIIRPDQRAWVQQERVPWTSEQRLDLTIKNLIESNTVIGILERIDTTVELMRFVLDKDRQVPPLAFDYFGSPKLARRIHQLYGNSTETAVAKIRKNPPLLALLKEYLHYEQKAYDWALSRHKRQVQYVRKKNEERNKLTAEQTEKQAKRN